MNVERRQKEELNGGQSGFTAPTWRDLILIPYTIRAIPEIVAGTVPFIKAIGLKGIVTILTYNGHRR